MRSFRNQKSLVSLGKENFLTEILTQIGKEEIALPKAKGLFSKAKINF